MPIMLTRRDGPPTPFRNAEYIPFYYFIPKSILSRCGAELNAIPRNPQELFHNRAACEFVESDLFRLLIIDATAFMVWPYMGFGEYMEIYSGYDPAWRFAHCPDYWIQELTDEGILASAGELFKGCHSELGYVPEWQIDIYLRYIVPNVMNKYRMNEIIQVAREYPCFEDFDFRKSNQKTDFIRKWYHTRTKHPIISLEEFQEAYADAHGGQEYEEPDPSQNVEETVVAQALVDQFKAKIYFPEYLTVYKNFSAESGLTLLETAPLPKDVVKLGAEGINRLWRDKKLRAVGMKRAQTLVGAAQNSIGLDGGACARMEVQLLLEDYRAKEAQLERVTAVLEAETLKVPYAEKLLSIKGVGLITVAGFLSEVGDIRRFDSPKQIQKLAGLELKENSSGKHRGRSSISKRGRKRLRKILFQVMLPMIQNNAEFREVYQYFRTREKNPLKGKQAIVAASCKLIRVFYAILKRGVDYDPQKLRTDIIRPELAAA